MKSVLRSISEEIRAIPSSAFAWGVALAGASRNFGRGWGLNREDKAMVLSTLDLMGRHVSGLPNSVPSAEVDRVMLNIAEMQKSFGKYSRQIAFIQGRGDMPPGKELGEKAAANLLGAIKACELDQDMARAAFRSWADNFWVENVPDINASEAQGNYIQSAAQRTEHVSEPAIAEGYGDW